MSALERLARLQDEREKDEEELELEAALFGKKRKRIGSTGVSTQTALSSSDMPGVTIHGEDQDLDEADDVSLWCPALKSRCS